MAMVLMTHDDDIVESYRMDEEVEFWHFAMIKPYVDVRIRFNECQQETKPLIEGSTG